MWQSASVFGLRASILPYVCSRPISIARRARQNENVLSREYRWDWFQIKYDELFK